MSIEEKARAYDEALEKAKELLDSPRTCFDIVQLKDIFPELRESEDERIRNKIIWLLQQDICPFPDEEAKQMIAWLEKKKEEKHATIEQVYEKFLSSDTLKLAKENKYIKAQVLWELMHNGIITEVDYQYLTDDKRKPWTAEEYRIAYQKGFKMSEQLKQKEHSMSAEEVLTRAGLKPYKDGNQWCILAGDNIQEGICGFGDTIDEALYQFLMEVLEKQKEQSLRDFIDDFPYSDEQKEQKLTATINGEPIPTENQSVDIPLAEWSEEDMGFLYEVMTMVQSRGGWVRSDDAIENVKSWLNALPERFSLQPKPEWSEEDEVMIGSLINYFEGDALDYTPEETIAWLKSLCPIVNANSEKVNVNWSEEDEKMLSDLRNTLGCLMNAGAITFKTKKKFSNWLKSLPLRCPKSSDNWKPSEEQLKALKEALETYKGFEEYDEMKSLYNDLKKLGVKEEPEYYQHFDPNC